MLNYKYKSFNFNIPTYQHTNIPTYQHTNISVKSSAVEMNNQYLILESLILNELTFKNKVLIIF